MILTRVDPFNTSDYLHPNCGGSNKIPVITWSNVPASAKSLALILHDPDAPVQGGWIHWIVFNIPPSSLSVFGNQSNLTFPPGTLVSKNSYGNYGYGGPCPPPGKIHHYNLGLYALDTTFPAMLQEDPSELMRQIQRHAIEKTGATKVYSR